MISVGTLFAYPDAGWFGVVIGLDDSDCTIFWSGTIDTRFADPHFAPTTSVQPLVPPCAQKYGVTMVRQWIESALLRVLG